MTRLQGRGLRCWFPDEVRNALRAAASTPSGQTDDGYAALNVVSMALLGEPLASPLPADNTEYPVEVEGWARVKR